MTKPEREEYEARTVPLIDAETEGNGGDNNVDLQGRPEISTEKATPRGKEDGRLTFPSLHLLCSFSFSASATSAW